MSVYVNLMAFCHLLQQAWNIRILRNKVPRKFNTKTFAMGGGEKNPNNETQT